MIKHILRNGPNGMTGWCGVDVFQSQGQVTVMLTELANNPGASVTNMAAWIATDIVRGLVELGVVKHPATVRWVEHYERTVYRDSLESWDEVELDWDGHQYHSPRWRPCNGDRYQQPDLGAPIPLDLPPIQRGAA